ncbi:GAF domain-containing hybrid sensor histidine kinase/response regulator [Azospirillum sp. B506]|uniref:GAF domain-containing hybrid sensor histidine kinase/response regulator n=1 Tax=Azospirillum sp. B506 TaxID=137721 RepID=UPI00034D6D19|nr:GAF domain-containing hybrid sensor histidine kinase/response regulator [Azospirillum sp. B506]
MTPRGREPAGGPEEALRSDRRRLLRQTMALHDITRLESIRCSDFGQALGDIARILAFTLHVDRVAVWTVTEAAGGLQATPVASHGLNAWEAEALPLSRFPLYCEALTAERSLVAESPAGDSRFAELLEPVLLPAGVISLVHLCVKVDGRPVALLRCEQRRTGRRWTDDEVHFIESVAGFVALASIGQDRNRAVQALHDSEKRLRQAKDQAEAATRAKSDFLAMMSHEIRTPMNGVLGMLDILGRSRLDAGQERSVAVIRDSAVSLLRIIDDILDFSKIEAGKLELDPVPLRLPDLVEGVTATLSPMAAEKGVILTGAVDPAIPPWLIADPVRLRQILLNLANNAIKFTAEGEIGVSISGLGVADGRAALRIAVRDSGIGLTREQADRLFQPFVQAEQSIARRFGGTGLGLSICHKLAERMGGRIGVDSEPGRGSIFWVELVLPVSDVPPEPDPAAPSPDRGGEMPTLLPDGPILIADDHPINREVILRQLDLLGCAADAVGDGKAALDALARKRYVLLLTDWDMPEMDGLELTRAVRAREAAGSGLAGLPGRLPIVGITANAFSREVERCLAMGMDDCLTKPVETVRLGHCLGRWLPTGAPVQAPASAKAAFSPSAEPPVPSDAGEAIDTRRFHDLLGDDRAAIRGLLKRFLETSLPLRERLGEAIADGRSAEEVRQQAHALKGASGMVGASALATVCLALEKAAMADDWAGIGAASEALAPAWNRVNAFVDRY